MHIENRYRCAGSNFCSKTNSQRHPGSYQEPVLLAFAWHSGTPQWIYHISPWWQTDIGTLLLWGYRKYPLPTFDFASHLSPALRKERRALFSISSWRMRSASVLGSTAFGLPRLRVVSLAYPSFAHRLSHSLIIWCWTPISWCRIPRRFPLASYDALYVPG